MESIDEHRAGESVPDRSERAESTASESNPVPPSSIGGGSCTGGRQRALPFRVNTSVAVALRGRAGTAPYDEPLMSSSPLVASPVFAPAYDVTAHIGTHWNTLMGRNGTHYWDTQEHVIWTRHLKVGRKEVGGEKNKCECRLQ